MDPLDRFPYAKRVVDLFQGYMTGRETDYLEQVQAITMIELALENYRETLIELFLGGLADSAFRKHGKEHLIQRLSEWLRRKVAVDKLRFYRLGLLKTEQHGDLRKARWVTEDRELLFAALKFKQARTHPATIAYIKQEVAKMEPQFLCRLGKALQQPPFESKHNPNSLLQCFLLSYWTCGPLMANGQLLPALADCSDPVIAKLANHGKIGHDITSAGVKKTWQRLGLRKAPKIVFKHATKVRATLIISESRPRR